MTKPTKQSKSKKKQAKVEDYAFTLFIFIIIPYALFVFALIKYIFDL